MTKRKNREGNGTSDETENFCLIFFVGYLAGRKRISIFAATNLPRFPSEQRAQGKYFFYPHMKHYTERPLTVDEQIELLKQRGLNFADENKAYHVLSHVSYFRLKSYLTPLTSNKEQWIFKPSATFETAYRLYKFDSKLRKLIAAESEKVEVSIRTQMAYQLAKDYGTFWFLNKENFTNLEKHTNLLASISAELTRSDDDQILRFKREYDDEMPPAWMTMEVSSFGTLSMLYNYFRPGHTKREIAKFYGVSDSVFESWLHSIVYVRNICAHHSRLWNRALRIRPLFPRKTLKPFLSVAAINNRVYYVLSIIQYLLQTINPSSTFPTRLKQLIADFPEVDLSAMGFPKNWESEPLWR